MISPLSSEFVALCEAQIRLLAQVLGSTATALYLAEQTVSQETPTLIPVAAYPDEPETWTAVNQKSGDPVMSLPAIAPAPSSKTPPLPDSSPVSLPRETDPGRLVSGETHAWQQQEQARSGGEPLAERRLVLPLVHEGVVLGVLVSIRQQAAWSLQERHQAEEIADSLALACVLDQRGQWFQQRLQQKQITHSYQSETFHDLLHQFRNPLTALRTFGKLLLKRVPEEDANHSIVAGIVRESQRLQDLAGHFDTALAVGDAEWQGAEHPPRTSELALPARASTDLSSSEAVQSDDHPLGGDWHLASGQVREVIAPLVLTAQTVAQERQIHFFHAIPAELPPVTMNSWALQEVMNNLIDNALKYAPTGAIVWVQAGLFKELPDGQYQGIAVGDTGPGIPEADQNHIFERSYRGIQANSDIPGTGLGLAIAEELIQRMGGHIELYSPANLSGLVPDQLASLQQGPGTVFIIWLLEAQVNAT